MFYYIDVIILLPINTKLLENVRNFMSFVYHGRTRLSSSYSLQTPFCRTSTYQSSYFNRIVKHWNYVCNLSSSLNFSTPDSFKNYVFSHLMNLLKTSCDIKFTCTWTMIRNCPAIINSSIVLVHLYI